MKFYPGQNISEIVYHFQSNETANRLDAYFACGCEEDTEVLARLKQCNPRLLHLSYAAFCLEMGSHSIEEMEYDDGELIFSYFQNFLLSIVSNSSKTTKLRAYIRSAFAYHFQHFVEFDQYTNDSLNTVDTSVSAQGIADLALSMVRWIPTQIKKVVNFGVGSVIESFSEHFNKLLMQYCPIVFQAFSWVNNIWTMVKEWIEEAAKEISWFLQGCKELLAWGMCILASSCALGLVEKCLISLGMISESFDLVGLFVRSAIVGAFCVSIKTGKFITNSELVTCATIAVSTIATVMSQAFKPSEEIKGQFQALSVLEGLATQLTSFCDTSLVAMGKTCTAFNQICTAGKNVKVIAGRLLEVVSNFVRKLLGLDSAFLRDAALIFSQDVDGWLRNISWCQEQFLLKAYMSQDDLIVLRSLVVKGERMREQMLEGEVKVSPSVCNLIVKGCEEANKLMRESALHCSKTIRKIPFVIFAHGESRVGKSLLVDKLITDFCDHLEIGEDAVYSRNPSDPFWSGYRRQPIVTIDDFAAVVSEPSAEAQLIPLVSSAPYPLNMAGLEEKGMHFDSQIMMCSSNFLEPSPEAKIRDDMAFRNRRHVLITVELKPGVEYDESDFTKNQRYLLKTWFHDHYVVDQTFESYADLLAHCFTKWERHVKEQESNLSQIKGKKNESGHFNNFQQLMDLAVSWNLNADIMKNRIKAERSDMVYVFSAGRKDKIFHCFLNKEGECTVRPDSIDDPEAQALLKASETMLMKAYAFLKYNNATNLIVRTHLAELVNEDFYDEKFNFIGTIGTPAFHRQIAAHLEKMPLWQKAILCGMGHCLSRKSKETWYTGMKEKFVQMMKSIYETEVTDWPVPLKIISGTILATILGTTFWKLFSFLRDAGNGGVFVGNVASAFTTSSVLEAQSRKPNRYEVSQYRYRNVPIKRRAWVEGQMSFDQSVVAIMSKCKASMRMGNTDAQILMVPGRRFIAHGHFFKNLTQKVRVQIVTSEKSYWHVYDPDKFQMFDNSEIGLYTNPTLEDIPHSAWDLFCWDSEKTLPNNFSAELLSCKLDTVTGQYYPEWAPINCRVHRQPIHITEGNYVRKQDVSIEYDACTIPNDCGSLVVAKVGNHKQIVGFHVAGSKGRLGYASLIPYVEPVVQAQSAEVYFDFFPVEVDSQEGVAHIGELKSGVYVPLPTKTNLVETPKEWQLDLPCDKIPSVLTTTDERLVGTEHEGYDPFLGGIQKYATPMMPLDEEILSKVAQDMVEEWFDCVDEEDTFEEVSLSAALNGVEGLDYMERIPLATSEGFPHVLSRKNGEKGKRRFVTGDGEEMSLIPGTSVEEAYNKLTVELEKCVPTLVGIECPKDEKLPRRKIFDKPKTRCFTILPMEFNLVVRQKFLNFVRFIMKKRDKLSCQVGINPYSMEWTGLANRLLSKGNDILCCDYASFDGLITKQVMSKMAEMINSLCGGDEKLMRERTHLLLACCSRMAICKKDVWRVECGIPSGFPLTVICNSIFNEMLIRYSYEKLLRQAKAPSMFLQSFKNFISLCVYGDDNLISVHEYVKPYFSGSKLKSFLASHNITITDGIDKTSATLQFRKLSECDFLKRNFKQMSNVLWVAPEDKASLWSQLHYVSCNNLEMQEAYLVNLVNVLRELYLHSPEEARQLRRKALSRIEWLQKADVPTIAQIEEFHSMQRIMNAPDSNDNIDLLLSIDLLGLQGAGKAFPNKIVFDDKLVLANTQEFFDGNFPTDSWLPIFVNCLYPVSQLPAEAVTVNVVCGSGRGGLPTTAWISSAVNNRSSDINKKIRTALGKGKKIVFLTRVDPFPVALLAVLFGVKNEILSSNATNPMLTRLLENCKSLKYLVDECPFAFVN
uniref:RNA1 polyprotein n=1 Tax=Bean pod mottle virus TaxID=12260 RepID=A0A7T7DN86_9SECO|nr:polyprotein [Bean pod mottle virus]